MWYGASAQAPACRISPLHGNRPQSEGRQARQNLQKLHPTWGPLIERRREREEVRRRAWLLDNEEFSASQARRPVTSGGKQGTPLLQDISMRPTTCGGYGDMKALSASLSLPALKPRLGNHSSALMADGALGIPPADRPVLLTKQVNGSGMLAAGGIFSTAAIHNAQKPCPRVSGIASVRSSLAHPEAYVGHRSSQKPPRPGAHKLQRESMNKQRSSQLVGRKNSEKAPKAATGTGHSHLEKQSNVLKNKRRNSFCDRLLEGMLHKKSPAEKKRLLLEAGRKADFQQQALRTTTKDSNKATLQKASHSQAVRIDRILPVFRAIAHSGVVTVGKQLAETLWLLGHPYPDHDFLDWVIRTECAGRESLDLEDFRMVITTYEERLTQLLQDCFRSYAGDHEHAKVPVCEIPSMLAELGVPLITGIEEEFEDMSMDASYSEFESIYDDLVNRAGLTQEEHNRLYLIFEELEGLDGTINSQELLGALSWHESLTDIAGGIGVIVALVEETLVKVAGGRLSLDPSHWGKVAEAASQSQPRGSVAAMPQSHVYIPSHAFLAAANVLHSRIKAGLHEMLKKLKLSQDVVPSSALMSIFKELGIQGAMASDVDSFLLACNLESKDELTYPEFFTIIFRYCQADGVTEAESKDINAVFTQFDDDNSGTLEATEIGPVIRWLGYQPTQYRVYDFMEEIGLTSNSHIDALEFRRLVAKYKSTNLKNVRKAFLHRDRAADDYKISIRELTKLLNMVGYVPAPEEVRTLVQRAGGPDAFIDFHEFKELEMFHRRWIQQTMSRNSGFTDVELKRHHEHFEEGDPKGRGVISGKETRDITFTIFPDTSKDRHRHSFIVTMLKMSGIEPGSSVDFDEFMAIIKAIQEEIDREMLITSLGLKQEFGYCGAEIKQFHDLFCVTDEDNSGDLVFEELCDIFGSLTPLDMVAKRELMALVMEVGNEDRRVDFWGFLHIIHKVQSGTGGYGLSTWRRMEKHLSFR